MSGWGESAGVKIPASGFARRFVWKCGLAAGRLLRPSTASTIGSRSGGTWTGEVCERNVPPGCSNRSSVTPNADSKSETLPASTTRRFAAQLSMTLRLLARA